MNIDNHYTYRTEWSTEDNCFISRVLEFPSLSAFGETREESLRELDIAINITLEWMQEEGEKIPLPVTEKDYKGNIALRIPPETHRNVSIMSMNEGISVNQYITSLIERNMYSDSITTLFNSFEKQLQNQISHIQQFTLINFEIYKQILSLIENSTTTLEDKSNIFEITLNRNESHSGYITA